MHKNFQNNVLGSRERNIAKYFNCHFKICNSVYFCGLYIILLYRVSGKKPREFKKNVSSPTNVDFHPAFHLFHAFIYGTGECEDTNTVLSSSGFPNIYDSILPDVL